jgi:hypothetical protein
MVNSVVGTLPLLLDIREQMKTHVLVRMVTSQDFECKIMEQYML